LKAKATRRDISYITHKCARFSANPRVEHGQEAVRWLGRYLYATKDKGTIMKPIPEKDLEVFVDADFNGNWDPKDANWDTDTARSRHGRVYYYLCRMSYCMEVTTADGDSFKHYEERIHWTLVCFTKRYPNYATVG
jgi:hypothetical protein